MADRESGELLQVEGKAIEETYHMFEDYPISSFTSLICPQPISQYINPTDTFHYPISHDESIYDIPGDDSSDKTAKKATKGTSAAAKKRCVVSVGNVWQYTDEGDGDYEPQSYDDGENVSKKRKSSSTQQSNARRATSKMQIIKHDHSSDVAPQEDCQPGPQRPQLTITPDTGKGGRKRTTIPKKKKEQLPGFKNLTITKPASPPEKHLEREKSSSVLSYQGWTATQDALKSNHIALAKTTLDKLAAFTYKASAQPHSSNGSMDFTNDTWPPQKDQSLTSRPDAVNTSNGDSLFRQALWNIEENGPFTNEKSPASILRGPLPILVETSEVLREMNDNHHCHDDNAATITSLLEDKSTNEQNRKITESVKSEPAIVVEPSSQPRSDLFEPTSSEARAINNLLDVVEMTREDAESIYDLSKRLEMPPPIIQGLQRITSCQNNVRDQTFDDRATEYSKQEATSDTAEDPHTVTDSPGVPTDQKDNDFDDDLDDADFLAIAVEANLPKNINQNTVMHPPSTPLPKGSNIDTTLCNILKGRNEETPSSPMLVSSDSDIYPVEAGEEDDMLELCQSRESVIERFHAPASIQHAFEEMNEGREVYDSSLQFSPPNPKVSTTSTNMGMNLPAVNSANHGEQPKLVLGSSTDPIQIEDEDWSFMTSTNQTCAISQKTPQNDSTHTSISHSRDSHCLVDEHIRVNANSPTNFLNGGHECEPLDRFARPEFPELVRDRCPIVGVSSQSFLRVCFRVGELFREGARCKTAGQDGVIELFARVTFSSREVGSTKQHFQFADLWSENPPFPAGILLNYKASRLMESESEVFIGSGKGLMARCLGRLKRERKSSTGWIFYILYIRVTDWEEIRWTKRVVSAGAHRENRDSSKLGR